MVAMKTTLTCPVCEQPLHAETIGEKQLIFCAYGLCPSHAANEGGEGPTLEEARTVLCGKVQLELEQNEIEQQLARAEHYYRGER
jgi:hypothetical protein